MCLKVDLGRELSFAGFTVGSVTLLFLPPDFSLVRSGLEMMALLIEVVKHFIAENTVIRHFLILLSFRLADTVRGKRVCNLAALVNYFLRRRIVGRLIRVFRNGG